MRGTMPDQMRALQLDAFHEDVSEAIRSLKVVTKPVPAPRRGQVLVKVEAAPCNPSDLLFLQARYAQLKTLPAVPGWEGAGTVVASGGGWIARYLQGKRVACSIQGDRDGTWGQYAVANVLECIPLKSGLVDGARGRSHHQSAVGDGAAGHGSPCRPPSRRAHRRSESAGTNAPGTGPRDEFPAHPRGAPRGSSGSSQVARGPARIEFVGREVSATTARSVPQAERDGGLRGPGGRHDRYGAPGHAVRRDGVRLRGLVGAALP